MNTNHHNHYLLLLMSVASLINFPFILAHSICCPLEWTAIKKEAFANAVRFDDRIDVFYAKKLENNVVIYGFVRTDLPSEAKNLAKVSESFYLPAQTDVKTERFPGTSFEYILVNPHNCAIRWFTLGLSMSHFTDHNPHIEGVIAFARENSSACQLSRGVYSDRNNGASRASDQNCFELKVNEDRIEFLHVDCCKSFQMNMMTKISHILPFDSFVSGGDDYPRLLEKDFENRGEEDVIQTYNTTYRYKFGKYFQPGKLKNFVSNYTSDVSDEEAFSIHPYHINVTELGKLLPNKSTVARLPSRKFVQSTLEILRVIHTTGNEACCARLQINTKLVLWKNSRCNLKVIGRRRLSMVSIIELHALVPKMPSSTHWSKFDVSKFYSKYKPDGPYAGNNYVYFYTEEESKKIFLVENTKISILVETEHRVNTSCVTLDE